MFLPFEKLCQTGLKMHYGAWAYMQLYLNLYPIKDLKLYFLEIQFCIDYK